MEKNRYFFWLYGLIILVEVLNLVFKIANPYYFNLIVLAILVILNAFLGKRLGIKIGWIVTLTVISLLLIGLLAFVVWN